MSLLLEGCLGAEFEWLAFSGPGYSARGDSGGLGFRLLGSFGFRMCGLGLELRRVQGFQFGFVRVWVSG